ncbi:glycosyltransferase family 2 protein [Aquibacillus saliphilus]|uniref:glycosyltransferase family 2 protein n=1 Tax=Aquibacillus saliphilus TaxID=1909422 RepID=UPI001CEFBE0D|nr:glycosyltransferase family A protein [Aquibacillus saliphilus]
MISLLLPTLGTSQQDLKQLFNSLESQTNQDFELIVISQDNHNVINTLLAGYSFSFNHIELDKRGLSLARNVGLEHVNGDILTFSDDDCWYKEDAFEYIEQFFKRPSRQIACFMHKDPIKNRYPKVYPVEEENNISRRRVLQQASIDIFVQTKRVPDYTIGFDESFGLGTRYKSGEENIFLMDLKNKGYQIDYVPKLLSYHPIKDTLHIFDVETLVGKGPMFKRLFGRFQGLVLLVAFIIKNYNLIKEKRSIANCFLAFFNY